MTENMSIEEMRKHEWTISWSGGKDSTATIILCHEYGIPIKEIIYVRMMYDENTPATLPIMTEFVDRTIKTFEGWGYKVTVVKSKKTALQIANTIYKRSKYNERNGKRYGVSNFGRGFCKFSGVKMDTIKELSKGEYELIGYACDEIHRLKVLSETKQSILVNLGIREEQTYGICNIYNLCSPLYDLGLTRDGCWFCPNIKKKEIEMLKRDYRHVYDKSIDLIEMCDYDLFGFDKINNWYKYYKEIQECGEQISFNFSEV